MDFFEILRILAITGGGLIAGSFINCVIWRLHTAENFITGRSYCPHCRHKLVAIDLVPVFSFVALAGKCRYCAKKISWLYPAVEIATAIMALAVTNIAVPGFLRFGFIDPAMAVVLVYYWAILAVLEIIFESDILWYIIPDEAVVAGAVLAVVMQIFAVVSPMSRAFIFGGHDFGNLALTAVFSAFVFLAIVLVSKGKWMGLGDVKYAFLMGLLLGFPQILFGLFAIRIGFTPFGLGSSALEQRHIELQAYRGGAGVGRC